MNGAATDKGDMTIAQYYNQCVVSELMKEYPDVGLPDGIKLSSEFNFLLKIAISKDLST